MGWLSSKRIPATTVRVSQYGGGDYDSIQDAIDSITDASASKPYTVEVYNGTYVGAIVCKDHVSIVGMGTPDSVVITFPAGVVVTWNTGSGNTIRNLSIVATGNAQAVNLPSGSTYNYFLLFCNIVFSSVDNYTTLIRQQSGALVIRFCIINFIETMGIGTGGVNINRILLMEGTSECSIVGSLINAVIGDTNDDLIIVDEDSAATVTLIVQAGVVNATVVGGNCTLLYAQPAGVNNRIQNIQLNMISALGNGIGRVFTSSGNTTGICSTAGRYSVTGFAQNYFSDIPSGDTICTKFDNIFASEFMIGAGIRQVVSSEAATGALTTTGIELSGDMIVTRDATGLAYGDIESVMSTVVQSTGSTGGDLHVLSISQGGIVGSAEVVALSTSTDVEVIHQHTGVAGAVGKAWKVENSVWSDVTVHFNAGGTDTGIFTYDNDYIYVGLATMYDEINVVLDTLAGQDILATFEYYKGAPTNAFTAFTPSDGTLGFRQNGNIQFDSAGLTGWATTQVNGEGDGPWYYIRIQRTRNNIVTTPIEDTIQVTSVGEYSWDKDGVISTASIVPSSRLSCPIVTDAGPMTATAGIQGDIVFNTSDSKHYGCTVTGSPATWSAFY